MYEERRCRNGQITSLVIRFFPLVFWIQFLFESVETNIERHFAGSFETRDSSNEIRVWPCALRPPKPNDNDIRTKHKTQFRNCLLLMLRWALWCWALAE